MRDMFDFQKCKFCGVRGLASIFSLNYFPPPTVSKLPSPSVSHFSYRTFYITCILNILESNMIEKSVRIIDGFDHLAFKFQEFPHDFESHYIIIFYLLINKLRLQIKGLVIQYFQHAKSKSDLFFPTKPLCIYLIIVCIRFHIIIFCRYITVSTWWWIYSQVPVHRPSYP